MASQAMSSYGVKNCLLYAFNALRSTDRLIEDSLQSPYELFHENLARSLSRGRKIEYSIANSEVEAFYLKRSSENDFIASVQSKILCRVNFPGPGVGGGGTCPLAGSSSTFSNILLIYGPLFTHTWDLVSERNADICSKLPSTSGKQLWEIFLKLDTESELKVHVDDIVEVILKIFKANGHNESESKIKEWFRGDTNVSFRAYFTPLVDKFVGLLQAHTIMEINREIVSEFFKEGKLEKKGHVVHNWKMRWFVLTGNSLTYYETQEKAVVKGSLVINSNAVVQNMPEYRARPHRFRVICGESKTVTEISVNDSSTMQEWIYTIRMAIKIHQTDGRNFIHKWKILSGNKSYRKGVPHSTSMDKVLAPPSHPPPKHRGLSATKSVPDARRSPEGDIEIAVRPATPASPISSEDGTCSPKGLSHSASYTDAPPLPPQRFQSDPDVKDLNSPQVLDKTVLAEKRVKDLHTSGGQRQGSLEPQDIEHIVVEGEDYAIVKKSPKRKKKLPADLSAIINPPADKSEPALAAEKKKMPGKQQSVDSALNDNSKKKKTSDNIRLPRSPKPARRNKDAMTPTGSPRKMPEKTNHDDISYSAISHVTDNGLDYAIVDTKAKNKSSNSSLTSPMSSEAQQLDAASQGAGKNESPEPRHLVIQSDDEKNREKRKIEYSTVVFANSIPAPEQGEEQKEVKDFDRTKFDYSTVVFQNVNLIGEDKKSIIKPQGQGRQAKGKGKKSIYDSDEDELDAANESPYMNVRRDGRPITTTNAPPVVPPRRGAAAIVHDDSS